MAKPRIFISSTYYDLRNIRSDLERYIKERNYDPILNEKGHIAYSNVKRLEEYCYKEIENCDIVISVIGGRFGSAAHETDGYSISQKELKTAFEKGKQVYIFIEKAVLHEYKTYEKNKEDKDLLKKIKFSAVDNIKIYEFLDEVFNLPVNNQYTGFETSNEIINYLQEQWSSLFQSLLQDASKQKEIFVLEDLKATAKTLNQLVTFLTNEKKEENNNIKEILFMNHPVFNEIKSKLKLRVRVFFYNLKELTQLLKLVGFNSIDEEFWDDPSHIEFFNEPMLLKIDKKLFDDSGKLVLYTPEEWDENLVIVGIHTTDSNLHELDDDLPF